MVSLHITEDLKLEGHDFVAELFWLFLIFIIIVPVRSSHGVNQKYRKNSAVFQ